MLPLAHLNPLITKRAKLVEVPLGMWIWLHPVGRWEFGSYQDWAILGVPTLTCHNLLTVDILNFIR